MADSATLEVDLELYSLDASVAFDVEGTWSTGLPLPSAVKIKGFASVQTQDRHNDIVDPTEFKIAQFMASPALLVNHDFYYGSGVGRVTAMNAVKIVKVEDDLMWGLKDLDSKEVVNTYPKIKVPNLSVGDRGLFVTAQVTELDIIRKVLNGEISAFSWRGLARADYRVVEDGSVQRFYTDIDLWEISLVNVPDNPDATFVVSKSATHIVQLSKDYFATEGVAKEYLKAHGLRSDRIKSDHDNFYGLQADSSLFADMTKFEVVKMAHGVQIVAGPLKALTHPRQSSSWGGRSLGADHIQKVVDLYSAPKETKMANVVETTATEITPAVPATAPSGVTTESTAAVVTTEEKPVVLEKGAVQEIASTATEGDSIASSVVTGLMAGLTPIFEAQTSMLKTMNDNFAAFAKSVADNGINNGTAQVPETNTDQVIAQVTKSAVTPETELTKAFGLLNDLAAKFKAQEAEMKSQQDALVLVAKSVQSFAQQTPKPTVREEVIKTAVPDGGKKDPNACLDGLFAFISPTGSRKD